jgi:membrane fusion protein (multidrug efflux system)
VKRTWARLAVGASLALVAGGCSSDRPVTVSAASPVPAAAAQPAPKVEQAEGYQATGPLVVERQVDVAAQREGVVARILVDVGSPVRKGELLAQLDDRQLTAARDAAVAKEKGVEADAHHWEAEVKMREADFARSSALWDAQLITKQQLEHDRYSVDGGHYYLERQRHDLQSAQAERRSIGFELEKTRIVAPFDGVVARRYVRIGQKVASNDRLFWVTATAPLNVRFTLPQEFVTRVKLGDAVTVSAPSEPTKRHAAKIMLVSPVVDPSSGTIEVQAQVIGPPGELRPGMTVSINVKPQ